MRRLLIWIGAGIAALAVVVTGGTYIYIHYIEGPAPAPLALRTATPAGAGPVTEPGALSGVWKPAAGSQAGYRVKEVLFGQDNEAVGRTTGVTGSVTMTSTAVTAADFTIDMTSVKSDRSQRDRQFQGRIMDTASYPTSTWKLTQPIALPATPMDKVPIQVQAIGELTLHGMTKTIAVPLRAQRNGSQLEVNATIPVTFSDYGINDPSYGPVTTQNHGQIELLVVLQRAAA